MRFKRGIYQLIHTWYTIGKKNGTEKYIPPYRTRWPLFTRDKADKDMTISGPFFNNAAWKKKRDKKKKKKKSSKVFAAIFDYGPLYNIYTAATDCSYRDFHARSLDFVLQRSTQISTPLCSDGTTSTTTDRAQPHRVNDFVKKTGYLVILAVYILYLGPPIDLYHIPQSPINQSPHDEWPFRAIVMIFDRRLSPS